MKKRLTSTDIFVRSLCAIVFLIFSSSYLYFYQADLLAAKQHVLSGGITHYDKQIGTIVIVLVLFVLQFLVSAIVRVPLFIQAITYLPSLLTLAWLTDTELDHGGKVFSPSWQWLMPLLLVIFFLVVWLSRKLSVRMSWLTPRKYFVRIVWLNLLALFVLMALTCVLSNNNPAFHYRLEMEAQLHRGNRESALELARKQNRLDEAETMLLAYALAQDGKLGEKFFEFPVSGTAATLIPDSTDQLTVVFPVKKIHQLTAIRPRGKADILKFLKISAALNKKKTPAPDYLLCGYLLEKNIDSFAQNVAQYYALDEELPKHYREALTLYAHQIGHPVLAYQDSALASSYKRFDNIANAQKSSADGIIQGKKEFGDTYWWYYYSK